MIYFRADMNEIIATGHVMRCLSIADAAKKLGEDSTFILADEIGKKYIEERGYHTLVLNSKWDNLEAELPLLTEVIYSNNIESLVIDSYSVSFKYLNEISKLVKVTYLDDLHENVYPVKRVIHYDCSIKEDKYREMYQGTETEVLYGYEYVPLREEFEKRKDRIIKKGKINLLIMSGGTDSFHTIIRFLNEIDYNRFACVTAIVGILNSDYNYLVEKNQADSRVRILRGINNVSYYMRESDVCLSATGNTIFELAACCTPTVSFTISDAQIPAAVKFDSDGMTIFAGDMRTENTEKRIIDALYDLSDDYIKREKMANRMKTLVDAYGSFRIAKLLVDDCSAEAFNDGKNK